MQPILVAGIHVHQCPAALQQVSPAERGAVTIVTKEPATVGAVYSAVQLYSGGSVYSVQRDWVYQHTGSWRGTLVQ